MPGFIPILSLKIKDALKIRQAVSENTLYGSFVFMKIPLLNFNRNRLPTL
jgi:hypothetical protein